MGIDAILLEANAYCPEDMRASTFHPPSLEMMAELGVLDELEAAGLRAPVYQYRNRRTGNRVELDLAEIGDATPYPYRLQCEQFKLSRLLSARLAPHPHGRSLFQPRILGLAQDPARCPVSPQTPLSLH